MRIDAGNLARTSVATHNPGIVKDVNYDIRDLENPFEMVKLERVQQEAFGYDARDLTPASVLTVHAHMGGIVCAAYPKGSNEVVGFAYGFPGRYNDAWVLHSHILAINPEHRKSGLARGLKLHQRARAVTMGYSLMTWTFDPLIARNARLNLGKLGARAVSYHPDWYALRGGIYAGLPADRFIVNWDLTTPSEEHPAPAPDGALALEANGEAAGTPVLELSDAHVLIEVPRDIEALKARDLEVSRTWRDAHRVVFPHYLQRGYVVTDLCVDAERTFYRLERANS
jgi:predicted GNAT superfamily acetyltransferase